MTLKKESITGFSVIDINCGTDGTNGKESTSLDLLICWEFPEANTER